MVILHDPAVRAALEERLGRLNPAARPAWGKMSVDQMLWHVNQAIASSLGEIEVEQVKPPLPKALIKFMVLSLPWMKNAPTNPAYVPKTQYDFSGERDRCRRLMAAFAAKKLTEPAQDHPAFGSMTMTEQSKLHAKHLDYHFKQFGA